MTPAVPDHAQIAVAAPKPTEDAATMRLLVGLRAQEVVAMPVQDSTSLAGARGTDDQ